MLQAVHIILDFLMAGCPTRIPSDIVERILQTLQENESQLRRKYSVQSFVSTSSYGASTIPSRFQIFNYQKNPCPKFGHVHNPTASDIVPTSENVSEENTVGKLEEDFAKKKSDDEESDCASIDVSDNSDWSDEEKERFDKIFGKISERAVESRKQKKSGRDSRRNVDSMF